MLIEDELAPNHEAVLAYTGRIDALAAEPDRLDLAWALGLDEEVTDRGRRCRELRNFIASLKA